MFDQYGSYTLLDVQPMLTDADVQNHPYLQEWYDFMTLGDIAAEYGVSLDHLRVYSTTWSAQNGTTWTDVTLMIEVDGVYLILDWL